MEEGFVKLDPDDVEEAFGELAQEKIDNTEFLQTLVQSKLFTLMDRPGEGALAADKPQARMMRVSDSAGDGDMVPLFTDPDSARQARERAPGFEHLSRVDVIWALLRIEPEEGVLIHSADGRIFRIAPDGVAQLRQSVEKAIEESARS